MKLYPMNGRVVAKPLKDERENIGGIYLPDTAKEKLNEGKVIAIADDATDEIAVGDRIIYKEFGGTEIKIEDEKFVLLTGDDMLAKYEDIDKIPE